MHGSEAAVRQVLALVPDGLTAFEIAQRCTVDSNTIRRILRASTWAYIDGTRKAARGWAVVWKVREQDGT